MVSSSGRANKKEHAPRMIVALPRAVPIPLPLIAFGPTRLNLVPTPSNEKLAYQVKQDEDLHWRILQHVRDNEESDHTSPDVHLIELGHTAIALRDGDLLERDVEVVLRCRARLSFRADVSTSLHGLSSERAHLRRVCHGRAGPS